MRTIRFEVKPAINENNGRRTGKWYWVEIAGNGEPDGVSQLYTRKADAKRAAIRKMNTKAPYLNIEVLVED